MTVCVLCIFGLQIFNMLTLFSAQSDSFVCFNNVLHFDVTLFSVMDVCVYIERNDGFIYIPYLSRFTFKISLRDTLEIFWFTVFKTSWLID